MKTAALLLSFFFAFLITVPCNDKVADALSYQQQHSEEDAHKDICSVFCTCSCCGIVMSIEHIEVPIPEQTAIVHTSKIPDFQQFSLSNIPNGIWQPPKI